jgi:hypothetical protein
MPTYGPGNRFQDGNVNALAGSRCIYVAWSRKNCRLATDTSFVVWAGPLKSLKGQRPAPDLKVLGWLDVVDEDRVFISVRSIYI